MPLKIKEIFSNLCGEGVYTGYPMTFIQFSSATKGKKLSIDTIMKNVSKMKNNYVCLKGKEPLAQDEAISIVYELVDKGYKVCVETDNSYSLVDVRSVRGFIYLVNVKCPSSGLVETNVFQNLSLMSVKDEVKFVIADIEDYVFAKNLIKKYQPRASVIFTPAYDGKKSEIISEVAQWLVEDKLYNVRLGVPIHKVI